MKTWEIINKINSLKQELKKYMERTDYASKKARCVEIILELRELEKEYKEK